MLYHIRTAVTKTIASIFASNAYRFRSFLDHYHGPEYKALLYDYDNALRSKVKYTTEKGSYEEARSIFLAYLQDRGINLWD
jgi:hypothetical protein